MDWSALAYAATAASPFLSIWSELWRALDRAPWVGLPWRHDGPFRSSAEVAHVRGRLGLTERRDLPHGDMPRDRTRPRAPGHPARAPLVRRAGAGSRGRPRADRLGAAA